MSTIRQFALGTVGGLLLTTSAYNFSRTSMEADFDYLKRKIDGMSEQLRIAARAGSPAAGAGHQRASAFSLQELEYHSRVQEEYSSLRSGVPKPNVLTSFADAWNRMIVGTGQSVTGRY
ncbi:hypothetical protein H9P43_001929 [Blastocladiella emersonii ATCC 22665]|nr:hypothetical protein H9P43_001929 [Blastocladiella emersonii ATCC 22665]